MYLKEQLCFVVLGNVFVFLRTYMNGCSIYDLCVVHNHVLFKFTIIIKFMM